MVHEFSSDIDKEVRIQLSSHIYRYSDGEGISVLELMLSWMRHVRRFIWEANTLGVVHGIWTQLDYLAALFIRDRIDLFLGSASDEIKNAAEPFLLEADALFTEFTSEDDGHLLEKLLQLAEDSSDISDRWWWHRIPNNGLVLAELKEL
jgi:hypothetical protein